MIKGFGANSNQGAFRNYNEDRMSLVSKNKEGLGFFGVFDGHGGYAAAEYLKEHLVHLLFHDPKFKSNIE
jgi:serine/threonine protein phosphatase PrpC